MRIAISFATYEIIGYKQIADRFIREPQNIEITARFINSHRYRYQLLDSRNKSWVYSMPISTDLLTELQIYI